MTKRKAITGLTLAVLVAILAAGIAGLNWPRCCVTWANARMWQGSGYFPGLAVRQVEEAIYARCYEIGCQWQVKPGFCPSQYGVEQVAASWGMPGYVNHPRWDWDALTVEATAGAAITYFWTGPDYTGPDGLMHAYWCSYYEPPRTSGSQGRFWCTDALNVLGCFWDGAEIYAHWSGWTAGWRP